MTILIFTDHSILFGGLQTTNSKILMIEDLIVKAIYLKPQLEKRGI